MEQPQVDSNIFALASFGDRAGLEKCVEAGEVDLAAPDLYGRSPLHWAARMGRNDCITYLIGKELDKNAADAAGMTPLLHAAQNGKETTVKMLLDAGCDPHAADVNGNTAMHFAVVKGILGMVQNLEEHEASLTSKNKAGSTPAHTSSQNGQLVITRYFIKQLAGGAGLDEANAAGDTPLHVAAKCGFGLICGILVEGGANAGATNGQGLTPAGVATGSAVKALA